MAALFNPEVARILRAYNISLREFWQNLSADFSICTGDGAEYRFIDAERIDSIMQEELTNDLYLIGSFQSWALSELTGISSYIFETLQKAEANEGIGQLVLQLAGIEKIQANYVHWDGYGHHFAHYDNEEIELKINEVMTYYMFRTN